MRSKQNIIKIVEKFSTDELKGEKNLKNLSSNIIVEQIKGMTECVQIQLQDYIAENNITKINQKTEVILSLYGVINAIISADAEGEKAKELLKTPNLFLMLFKYFEIQNTKYINVCSVDDNIYIYEFLMKVVEGFEQFDYKIDPISLLSSQNLFVVFISIMQENFSAFIASISKMFSWTEEEKENKKNQTKKEYKENIETIKRKLLSTLKGGGGHVPLDLSELEAFFSEKLIEFKEDIVKASSIDSAKEEIVSSISLKIEDAVTQITKEQPRFLLEEMEQQESVSNNSQEFLQFKEDIIETIKQEVNIIVEKNMEKIYGTIENAKEVFDSIESSKNTLEREMSTLKVLATKVDEIAEARAEHDIKLDNIISLLEKQNIDATKMIESIKKGEI